MCKFVYGQAVIARTHGQRGADNAAWRHLRVCSTLNPQTKCRFAILEFMEYSSNTNYIYDPLQKSAMREKRFLMMVRELMECARGFERYSAAHVRELGLTPAQFDIIATLGNTQGMSCKELGEKTLITKGTMTGVLDRLEAKGMLNRHPCADDGRSWITKLTPEGQAFFEQIFPAHMHSLRPLVEHFGDDQLDAMRAQLQQLRTAFETIQPADIKIRSA